MVKQILFLFFVFLLLNSLFLVNTTNVKAGCFANNVVVPNGLIVYWRFDEGYGNIAYDYSGNNNNGQLINNPQWVFQGIYGYALKFNALQSQYVKLQPFTPPSGQVSVSVWIYPTAFTQNARVIDNWQQNSSADWIIYIPTSGYVWWSVQFTNGSWTYIQSPSPLQINTWYNIVGIFNGTTMLLYINSNLVATKTVNAQLNTKTNFLEIGGAPDDKANEFFTGLINDLRIYNRALSSNEIQQIYQYSQNPVYKYCQFTTSTTVYQNQIVQTNTAQGYNYLGIDPYNIGVLALILMIGFLFFVFERRLILIGIGIGFLIAYFFLGINIGFVLLGFIFIILNIILIRRYE